jgi:hypothetical protein
LSHGSGFLRLEAVGSDNAAAPFWVGAVLDAAAGIGISVDQGERIATVTDDRQMLGMASEAHQQDGAWRDIADGFRQEMLITERSQSVAVGNAAIGLGVEIE